MADVHIIDVPDEFAERSPEELNRAKITKDFLLAGQAYFVVVSPNGKKFYYCIRGRMGKPGSKFSGQMSYYVRVHHKGEYQYVGVIETETGDIKATGRSQYLKGVLEFDVAQWAVKAIFEDLAITDGYVIAHNEKCGKCGRHLKEPGDRATGFHLQCTEPSEPEGV